MTLYLQNSKHLQPGRNPLNQPGKCSAAIMGS